MDISLPVLARVGDDKSDLLPMILFFREPNMLFLRSISLMLLSGNADEGVRQHVGLLKTETAIVTWRIEPGTGKLETEATSYGVPRFYAVGLLIEAHDVFLV